MLLLAPPCCRPQASPPPIQNLIHSIFPPAIAKEVIALQEEDLAEADGYSSLEGSLNINNMELSLQAIAGGIGKTVARLHMNVRTGTV